MRRYLESALKDSLGRKIVLLSGPRQVGKTTLAKGLSKSIAYYNYDIKKDFQVFKRFEWNRTAELVIFDELHKMKKWKLWLKGLYDDQQFKNQKVIVTGSARLDLLRKAGDSLAGRQLSFRLHPLDLKELSGSGSVEENYNRLLRLSGFPEPYLENSEKSYRLWRRSHLDVILRQDLLSLDQVKDLDSLEMLIEMLSRRVGATVSFNSLAEDLDCDDKTVKRWVGILEDLYIIFRVSPFSKNIARALKKAAKFYFYDVARVEGDESQKLENLVALSLRKQLDYLEDTEGYRSQLNFIRTREEKEIDFVVQSPHFRSLLIEVKLSDASVSPSFHLATKVFPQAKKIQLVKNLDREFSSKSGDVRVCSALNYLETLKLDANSQ